MVFFRDLDNSHKEIDKARKHNTFYGVTEDCELFSNELTKLRVLDVPGFFGNVRDLRSDDLECRMKAVQNYDLFTMRTIWVSRPCTTLSSTVSFISCQTRVR